LIILKASKWLKWVPAGYKYEFYLNFQAALNKSDMIVT